MSSSKSRFAAALAAVLAACTVSTAHATYPGENGVIVFENPVNGMIGRIDPSGRTPLKYLKPGKWPTVSPNGKKIAYTVNDAIHVMNIDGSNDVQVTTGYSHTPVWVSGDQLDFISSDPNDVYAPQACLVELDGSNLGCKGPEYGFVFDDVMPTSAAGPIFRDGGTLFFLQKQDTYYAANFTVNAPRTDARIAPENYSSIYVDRTHDFPEVHETYFNGLTDRLIPFSGHVYSSANVISPDGTLVAAGVGGSAPAQQLLQTRPRAGGAAVNSFGVPAQNPNWSRVPKNCRVNGSDLGEPDFYADQCVVAVMPDGGRDTGILMQAAAIGSDGYVYHKVMRMGPTGKPWWSLWAMIPGPWNTIPDFDLDRYGFDVTLPAGMIAKKIAIAGAKDGSLQMVVVAANHIVASARAGVTPFATDGVVYHTMRYADGSWQPANAFRSVFSALDGAAGAAVFQARDVAITINGSSATSPGNAQIIANGANVGGVYHRVRWSDGSWSPFSPVPGTEGLNTRELAIAAAPDPDGNTYVLATVVSGNTSQIMRQVRYAGGNWDTTFAPVGVAATLPANADIAVTVTSNNVAQLMYSSGGLTFLQERANPVDRASWTSSVSSQWSGCDSCRSVSISAQPSDSPSAMMSTVALPQ